MGSINYGGKQMMLASARDISGLKRAAEVLQESEERFRSLVQNASDMILVLGIDGTLRYVSPSVEHVLGHKVEDIIVNDGSNILHPDDEERVQEFIADAVKCPDITSSVELRLRYANGSWRHIESTCNSLLDDPAVGGIVINSRDVTERKETEEALRKSEAGLAVAQRIAHVGSWEYDVGNDEARWSEELYRIFGFAPRTFVPTYRSFLSSVQPGDRARLRSAVRETLYHGRQGGIEYRIVRPDGEVRFVYAQYEVVYGADDKPAELTGTVQDITERKTLEEQLKYRAFHDTVTDLPNRPSSWTDSSMPWPVRRGGSTRSLCCSWT